MTNLLSHYYSTSEPHCLTKINQANYSLHSLFLQHLIHLLWPRLFSNEANLVSNDPNLSAIFALMRVKF